MTKTQKRRLCRKRAKAKSAKMCTSKRQYTEMEAAHSAGYQALKFKVKLCIYKCPYGDHWHLTRSANHARMGRQSNRSI